MVVGLIMKLGDILSLKSCNDGNELFKKVGNLLIQFDVSVYNDDGSVKDLYTLCCDVIEVLNKEK